MSVMRRAGRAPALAAPAVPRGLLVVGAPPAGAAPALTLRAALGALPRPAARAAGLDDDHGGRADARRDG